MRRGVKPLLMIRVRINNRNFLFRFETERELNFLDFENKYNLKNLKNFFSFKAEHEICVVHTNSNSKT